MYDEFDDDEKSRSKRRPPTWQIIVLIVGAGLLLLGAASAVINHQRVQHSNHLAVKYGLASSTKNVSLTSRCVAFLRNDYDHSSASDKAGLPPGGITMLAPTACSLGVQHGVVRDDGSMSYDNANKMGIEAIKQIGTARFQTLVFTELAVKRYHLAAAGHVTRADRCLAMGYSGYDALPQKTKNDYPARARMFRLIRDACVTGIESGLVPSSGAPTRRNMALMLNDAIRRERCACK
jgi:hypothetical protein